MCKFFCKKIVKFDNVKKLLFVVDIGIVGIGILKLYVYIIYEK